MRVAKAHWALSVSNVGVTGVRQAQASSPASPAGDVGANSDECEPNDDGRGRSKHGR